MQDTRQFSSVSCDLYCKKRIVPYKYVFFMSLTFELMVDVLGVKIINL